MGLVEDILVFCSLNFIDFIHVPYCRYQWDYTELQERLNTNLDDIYCNSDARNFWECEYNQYEENCSHEEDVFLTCAGDPGTAWKIRF